MKKIIFKHTFLLVLTLFSCLSIIAQKSATTQNGQLQKINPNNDTLNSSLSNEEKENITRAYKGKEVTTKLSLSAKKCNIIVKGLLSVGEFQSAYNFCRNYVATYPNNEDAYTYYVLSAKLADSDSSLGLAIKPLEAYNNYLTTQRRLNQKTKNLLLSNYNYQLVFYAFKSKEYLKANQVAQRISSIINPKEDEAFKKYSQVGKKEDEEVVAQKNVQDNPVLTEKLWEEYMAHTAQNAKNLYLKGQTFYAQKKYTDAKQVWEAAEKLGNKPSTLALGSLYENGLAVVKDYAKAKDMYQNVAGKEVPEGYGKVGFLYENGWGVPKDFATAKQWYQKGIETGDTMSIRLLASLQQREKRATVKVVVEKRTTEPNTYTPSAGTTTPNTKQKIKPTLIEQDNIPIDGDNTPLVNSPQSTEACYEKGLGAFKIQRYDVAKQYWELAASSPKPSSASYRAMDGLGNLYFNGRGVEADYKAALEWFTKGAAIGQSNGCANSAKSVGMIYENGFGVVRDFQKALLWYRRAQQMGAKLVENDISRVISLTKNKQ